jgi:two-component system chemotaxis sensor kinase CheA
MDTTQYLQMFLDESREHLQAVNDHLLKLEGQPQDLKIIDDIFRSAHTLKGMSATMGYDDIATLTHQMENVLDKLRKDELSVTTDVVDTTFEAVEYLEEMVSAISEGKDGKKDVSQLISRLERMEKGNHVSQSEEQGYRTCNITIQLNESCILKAVRIFMVFEILEQIGEVIKSVPPEEDLQEEKFERDFSVVLLTKESNEDIQNRILKVSEIENVEVSHLSSQGNQEGEDKPKPNLKPKPSNSERDDANSREDSKAPSNVTKSSKTIRVNIERIDDLMNLFEELVIDRGRLGD